VDRPRPKDTFSLFPLSACPSLGPPSLLHTYYTLYISLHPWENLKFPHSQDVRHTTAKFISSIDKYISIFHSSSISSSFHPNSASFFVIPDKSVKPSIIDQITFFEVRVDPYLQALQHNYYYPLSVLTMTNSSGNSPSTSDGIDTIEMAVDSSDLTSHQKLNNTLPST
jgi:hypothetical protein